MFFRSEAEYPKLAQIKHCFRKHLTMVLSLLNFKNHSLCQCLKGPNPDDWLEFSGLLQDQRQQRAHENNLDLFEVEQIPTNSTCEQRGALDEVHASGFEGVFRALFQSVEDH
ncbi:MAG: hypothetical protein F4Z87_01265 [Gammaproteobacteria bacterium]|nr:hypothetical protein [Gammaproteobacteria bacterium]